MIAGSFWRGLIAASALSLVAIFAFSAHANAQPRRDRLQHHHRLVQHGRHYHHVRRRWRRIHRVTHKLRPRSDVLTAARRFLGDLNPTGFRGPWCKVFVNMIARKTGHFFNRSKRAIDALRMGRRVRDPKRGDLAVMRNHVTFFAGYGDRGFLGLGGNQHGGHVALSSFPIRSVIAWIRLE